MTHVAIITDSPASLPPETYARYDIGMVSYYVHMAERVARDLVDLGSAEFAAYLAKLPSNAALPHTAHPGPGEYVEAYTAAAERADTVISFHMTSDGSGAYQSAQIAREIVAENLPSVTIHPIDTRNVSMCHGWMVLQAARAAAQGATLDDILRLIAGMLPVTRMLQTADTLRYLYMGGRIGRAQHLVGALLNIKPIISMEDGVITTAGVARSTQNAYRRMAAAVERAVGAGGRVRLALTHAAARQEALKLQALVERVVTPVEVLICELCPALMVHTGPGTVGLCYVPEHVAPF